MALICIAARIVRPPQSEGLQISGQIFQQSHSSRRSPPGAHAAAMAWPGHPAGAIGIRGAKSAARRSRFRAGRPRTTRKSREKRPPREITDPIRKSGRPPTGTIVRGPVAAARAPKK